MDNVLKFSGAIPFVNLVSGPIQIVYGKIQVILGAGSFFLHYGFSLAQSDKEKERILEAKAIKSLEYVGHGVLNIIRGIAVIFFLGLPILLIYDMGCKCKILRYRKISYYKNLIPVAT